MISLEWSLIPAQKTVSPLESLKNASWPVATSPRLSQLRKWTLRQLHQNLALPTTPHRALQHHPMTDLFLIVLPLSLMTPISSLSLILSLSPTQPLQFPTVIPDFTPWILAVRNHLRSLPHMFRRHHSSSPNNNTFFHPRNSHTLESSLYKSLWLTTHIWRHLTLGSRLGSLMAILMAGLNLFLRCIIQLLMLIILILISRTQEMVTTTEFLILLCALV